MCVWDIHEIELIGTPVFIGHKSIAVGPTGEVAYFMYSSTSDGTLEYLISLALMKSAVSDQTAGKIVRNKVKQSTVLEENNDLFC